MNEEFISESIRPLVASMDAGTLATGSPAAPRSFIWRGRQYTVDVVLATWRTTSDCTHGSSEQYVRKHWFHVRTVEGIEMKIYFDRQARSSRRPAERWWLYTLSKPAKA